MKSKNKQSGFSLLQVMTAIIVIAILTVSVIRLYQQAAKDAGAKALIDDIRMIFSHARALKGVEYTSALG